jgi:hypothetical protein
MAPRYGARAEGANFWLTGGRRAYTARAAIDTKLVPASSASAWA